MFSHKQYHFWLSYAKCASPYEQGTTVMNKSGPSHFVVVPKFSSVFDVAADIQSTNFLTPFLVATFGHNDKLKMNRD